MSNFITISKVNEHIDINLEDISMFEVAAGIHMYLEVLSSQSGKSNDLVTSTFLALLKNIKTEKPKEEIKLNNESEEGYVEV